MSRTRVRVRLRNLELLIAEAGSAAALARRADTSESYLSQIRNQLTTPKGTPRAVGDNLATKLERAMGKSNGWMDEMHREISVDPTTSDELPSRDVHGLHPLISWEQASRWQELKGNLAISDVEDLMPCSVRCGQDTFVLRVRGESMEPQFHDGDLIFVDPDATPTSGRYVVVHQENAAGATFRQLIVEEGHRYLKALNADWPNRISPIEANATIIGVVIFKGQLL